MGCFSSKQAEQDRAAQASGHRGNEYNPALDGPPDFGLGDSFEVSTFSDQQTPLERCESSVISLFTCQHMLNDC